MLPFAVRRLLVGVLVLWMVSVVVFTLTQRLPGDAAVASFGSESSASEADIEAARERLGLNDPAFVQYTRWMRGVIRGDFGDSFQYSSPVSSIVWSAGRYTLGLALAAWLISCVVGISAGVVAAVYHRTLLDRIVIVFSVLAHSVPIFWLGMLAIQLFALKLEWLPTGGAHSLRGDSGLWDLTRHLMLPAFTLGLYSSALIARVTRSATLEVLRLDFIRTAKSKGLARRSIVMHHALRNALLPVVTLLGLQLGHMLGGAVLVEAVFAWPGIGLTLSQAISGRDLPVISGVVFVSSAVFVIANIVVDILYGVLDPRIRVS